jgi:cytochrome c553
MPDVVADGRKPDVFACGHCHRPDGTGGPENSSLAGLPPAYFFQQMIDFKADARKSAVPKRIPVTLMTAIAHAATDDEIAKAAAYGWRHVARAGDSPSRALTCCSMKALISSQVIQTSRKAPPLNMTQRL